MIVLIVVNLTMKPFIFNFIWILDQDADAKQCVAESSRWYLTIWKSWKNLRLVTSAVSRGCISPSHFINFPPHWRAGCLSDETRRSYYFKSEPSISEPVANILMDDIINMQHWLRTLRVCKKHVASFTEYYYMVSSLCFNISYNTVLLMIHFSSFHLSEKLFILFSFWKLCSLGIQF